MAQGSEETRMMGLPDGRKKFEDRFSRLDTILAVTDSHPASQPDRHVAVASTALTIRRAGNKKLS